MKCTPCKCTVCSTCKTFLLSPKTSLLASHWRWPYSVFCRCTLALPGFSTLCAFWLGCVCEIHLLCCTFQTPWFIAECVLLYGWAAACVSVFLLMDIRVVYSFWLIWVMSEHSYRHFWINMKDSNGWVTCLWERTDCFPQWLTVCYPPTVCEISFAPHLWQHLELSVMCTGTSHVLNLQLSGDWWCWVSLWHICSHLRDVVFNVGNIRHLEFKNTEIPSYVTTFAW